MDINYLREFLMLAETNNYLEAADYLYVSQSTLTRHIQTLEAEIGTQLFNRTTRSVELNSQGKLFIPYARQIVQIQSEYMEALASNRRRIDSKLSIGTVPYMIQYDIASLFVEFRAQNPSVYLEMSEEDSFRLKSMLRRNQLDCALIWESDKEEKDNEFLSVPYVTDELVAVVSRKHPLARQDSVSLAALKEESLLLMHEKSAMYEASMDACTAAGFMPRIGYTGNQLDNLMHLASSGLGVALLMRTVAERSIDDSLKIVRLSTAITRRLVLKYRKKSRLSRPMEAFLSFYQKAVAAE